MLTRRFASSAACRARRFGSTPTYGLEPPTTGPRRRRVTVTMIFNMAVGAWAASVVTNYWASEYALGELLVVEASTIPLRAQWRAGQPSSPSEAVRVPVQAKTGRSDDEKKPPGGTS